MSHVLDELRRRFPRLSRLGVGVAILSAGVSASVLSPTKRGPAYVERLLLKGYKKAVRCLGRLYELRGRRRRTRGRADTATLAAAARICLAVGDSYMLDGSYEQAAACLSRYKKIADSVCAGEESRRVGLGLVARYFLITDQKADCIAALKAILNLDPTDTESLAILVRLTSEVGRQEEAEALYHQLELLAGSSIPQLTRYVLIPSGDLREVWRSYSEYKTPHPKRAQLWRGQDISSNSLLVVAVSGIGDELRSASTYAALGALAGQLLIACDPRLGSIFARSFPGASVIPMVRAHIYGLGKTNAPSGAARKESAWDSADFYVNNLASLQYTRPAIESFRGEESRLIPEPSLVSEWQRKLQMAAGGRLLVGICWRSGIMSYTRRREYFDLEDWAPILRVEGVAFVNLQYYGDDEIRRMQRADQQFAQRILETGDVDLENDFEALAALIYSCDLVVSSPTNILEYAGILGKESWMVTASSSLSANWRIVSDDGRDAWFRSVRHYSASRLGGKDAVIRTIRDDLVVRRTGPKNGGFVSSDVRPK